MNEQPYRDALDRGLRAASEHADTPPDPNIPASLMRNIDVLAGWRYDSPRTVLLTSLVKKSVNPEQDVRVHVAKLPGGYSGRGLDTKVVTPFLTQNGFPHMAESGWLTRSFEQTHIFDLNYPGQISGKGVREAFLDTIDAVERGGANPDALIAYMLWRLIQRRNKELVSLSKPTNLTISEIVSCLGRHFAHGGPGKARLPVLAIYAMYQQMVGGGGVAGAARYPATRTCTCKTWRPTRPRTPSLALWGT